MKIVFNLMWRVVLALVVMLSFGLAQATPAQAYANPALVVLGGAGNFAVLAETLISDAGGASHITGNVGLYPGTGAAIGLLCPQVTGIIYQSDAAGAGCFVTDPVGLNTATNNRQTAYTDANSRTPDVTGLGGGTVGPQTLVPGVYKWTTGVTITGDLVLSGGPNAVYIFQIAGTLDLAANKNIILSGGVQASNIFWAVAGATTLITGSHFEGNIIDASNIAMQTSASINGRLLSHTQVALDHNTIIKAVFVPPAATLSVLGISTPRIGCIASDVTVTALDAGNNVVPSYRGTVHFTSTDPVAVLPADYTFVAGDNGIHTFTNGVTLITAGQQTVTVTDVANSLTGTSFQVAVVPCQGPAPTPSGPGGSSPVISVTPPSPLPPSSSRTAPGTAQGPPAALPSFVITKLCFDTDNVTLCLKNTTAQSLTLVVVLKSNNVAIGQKTFNLSPNAELCASWSIDAAQAAGNLRVNIGGIIERDVPSCGVVVEQSIDWLLWVFIAVFVIAIIGLLLYFLTRRRK